MSTASWFLFSPGANNNSFVVDAIDGTVSLERLSSSSKSDLLNFINKYSQAKTFLVSTNSGQITDPVADKIENSDGSAIKYQFRREINGLPAVLGIAANGESVDILRSKLVSNLTAFLGKYTGASTCQVSPLNDSAPKPATKSNTVIKPPIEWIPGCKHFNSRNGVQIDRIIVHFTTTNNIESPIGHFLNEESEVSAHYIIGKDGRIVQMVKDEDRAFHCGSFNSASIGIEHVAETGDKLTPKQEASSIALIKFLREKHGIAQNKIFGHDWADGEVPRENGTTCPGDLWPDIASLEKWVKAKLS
jgi:N-acetylmuramoyl-L-alanine amidase